MNSVPACHLQIPDFLRDRNQLALFIFPCALHRGAGVGGPPSAPAAGRLSHHSQGWPTQGRLQTPRYGPLICWIGISANAVRKIYVQVLNFF